MNKNDLVTAVVDTAALSKSDAARAVDAVFGCITNSLQGGSDVRIAGFGSFTVVDRKATTGRNPKTGEVLQIAASRQAKFKPAKALKDAVRS